MTGAPIAVVRGQRMYSPQDRIRRKSVVNAETGCWEWTGTTFNGYGRLITGSRTDGTRRTIGAHRFSYQAFFGDLPDGMETCHRCDNRRCVNPEHLFAGTRQDNVDDREMKGRNNPPSGEKNGSSKLTQDQVLKIYSSTLSLRALARLHNVDWTTVRAIKQRKTWARVLPSPPADRAGG